jgi:L-fuconolactonase
MGRFEPRAGGAPERLLEWRKQPNMLGIRLTFMSPFSDLIDDRSLEWFWTTCEEQAIPLMAMVPRMLPKVDSMMDRHPNLTFVLDHLGSPFGKGPEAFSHLDELAPMTAKFPRLCVKWTSVPNFSQEPYPYRDIYPQLRRMYDMFGPKRIFWGSDITRLAGSYKECFDHVKESLDFLSAEDRKWILGRAISETLGWSAPIETASSPST